MSKFIKIYLVPGLLFQSLVIGGGYGTGRELVEFFVSEGPSAGLMGLIVSMIVWSIIMAISFEFARMTKSFEYKSFIGGMLGKGWIAFEIFYIASLILVISVVGSATGELTKNLFDIKSIFGVIGLMIAIGALAYFGSKVIERVLSLWSIALYIIYAVVIIVTVDKFGDQIANNLFIAKEGSNGFMAGIRYSSLNIALLPAVLFVARHFENRKQAIVAGLLGGPFAIIPGILIYISLISHYPQVLSESVPTDYLLKQINIPALALMFQIILLGTFVETGLGLIHGFNERIKLVFTAKGRVMHNYTRLLLAIVILVLSIFLAEAIGIIDLIAKGYKFMSWIAISVFVIPVLTIGSYRIIKSYKSESHD